MKQLFSFFLCALILAGKSQSIDVGQSAHRLSIDVKDKTIYGYLFLPNDISEAVDVIIAVHGSGGLVSDCADPDEIPKFKSQFRYWRDEVPKTGRAIFFVESFCQRGVDSFKSKTPPEDEVLSPYQIRAEDVKQSARLLTELTFKMDGVEVDLIDDQVWIGWSHGAGAVIAAGYKVPDNTDDLVFDVSSSGNEFTYGPPISESFTSVKGIMAWYGGYNFYGYFKDGSDIFYEPIDEISIVTHCGSNDGICFKDSNEEFIKKMEDAGHDVTRYTYDNVNHSFDGAKDDDSTEDQAARDLGRERAFEFFDLMFKEVEKVEETEEEILGFEESMNIHIYPNPVKEKVMIDVPTTSKVDFQLFDTSGRMVKSGSFNRSVNLSVGDLNQGMYWLKVTSENRPISERLIIKK